MSSQLNRELEMQSQSQRYEHNQVPQLPDTSPHFPDLEDERLPEYYSFNSVLMEHTYAQWSDATDSSMMATKGSTEASTSDEACAENGTFADSASFHSNSAEWTDLSEICANVSSEEDLECVTKTDEYHSVIEEEPSCSLTSMPCINPTCSASGLCTQESDVTYDGIFSSTSLSELNVKTTTACVVSHVSTSVSQETKTIQRPTSEKCTITDVCMADLNVLCEEFGKMRMVEAELMHLKDEIARFGSYCAGVHRSKQQKKHCGCGALSRATWAELRLLTLQFVMCQQHCWRCLYTSPQNETSLQGTEAVPDAMSQTLKILGDDYFMMKQKVLEGVPLDNLKPLSVDTKRLTDTTYYRPSLLYEALLGDSLPDSLFGVPENEGQTKQADVLKIPTTDRVPLAKNITALQDDIATSPKTASSNSNRVVSGSKKQPGVFSDSKHGVPKDLNSSEVWFDAEEVLGCDVQGCKEEKQLGQWGQWDSQKELKVDARRKKDQCFLLCLSNLPSSVTEHELLLWFSKYHTNQVSLSSFNNIRVAIVSVSNHKDAEAAISEMNGRCIQGHTLHVKHFHKSADDQAIIKESCVQLSPAAHKVESAEEGLNTHTSNIINAPRPFRCNLDKLTNICTTPTASGTYVPQHYGNMGSFEKIMAQLSARHPKYKRQQFISALLELRAKHRGVLSGLSLRDIVDMISELLKE